MSISANIESFLTIDIRITLITLFVFFLVFKLSQFYVRVFSLPPGPLPLPFLGNILYFRGTKEHFSTELEKVAEKYGPVFTFWTGVYPVVFISDIDIAKEAFRKNDFAGRPINIMAELVKKDQNIHIISEDYGRPWELLRRVAHSAVQKYSSTDKLVNVVSDCVDHTIRAMIAKEGLNKPFDPSEYVYNSFMNILATSAFGKRYELDDPEYKTIRSFLKLFVDDNQRIAFWEIFPILRKIDYKFYSKVKRILEEDIQILENKFQSHYKDYNESVVRDFCDTLISAKNDALREGKESAAFLTDSNLACVIFDLFFAGTDTSQTTFKWILFFMTYYPEVHQKLKEEIENQIGDRVPTHEDRDRCHYVMAVISEAMRLRSIVPLGLNHKAVATSKIGNYTIPKGTQVSVFQGHIMHKEEYWQNAKEFRPERFLENGKFLKNRFKAFIPFGVGRRVCLGERMALADLFLVLIRFIQKTSDYHLIQNFNGDTEPDPNQPIVLIPKYFEISLKQK